jgi:hyperosmotically inducible periplasmic protein
MKDHKLYKPTFTPILQCFLSEIKFIQLIYRRLKMKKQFFLMPMLCLLLSACENQNYTTDHSDENARRNGSDINRQMGTPNENEADRTITQKIRQALMEDNSISINGKNVKIITMNGIVTLRGIVNSEREKSEIGRKARTVSGVRNVDNQLEINRNEKTNS